MSILSVYLDSAPEQPLKVLTHLEDIASTLAEAGIHIERWEARATLSAGASSEEVIAAYRPQIEQLMKERGYVAVDVMSVNRNHPQQAELRARYLEEQRQGGDELRFFVVGRGLFMLHLDDKVYAVLCERNDLISVPAGTRHWFDMGEDPRIVAIRLFSKLDGCQAAFTGDDIAGRFPRLDD